MTIDINNEWVTDRRGIDLINSFPTSLADLKTRTLRDFSLILGSKGIDEDLIEVDNDDYPTLPIIVKLLTELYTYRLFDDHYGNGTQINDIYYTKAQEYKEAMTKTSNTLKLEHVVGTDTTGSYGQTVTIYGL